MQAKQLPLDLVSDDPSESTHATGSVFSDPAFAGNKRLPIHRWVPWIAGFSSDFVRQALHTYVHQRSTILDPFAGVGTTLVEAIVGHHDAVGFEINPYAALACRVKLHTYQIATETLHNEIVRFQEFYHEKMESGYTPWSMSPAGFKTRSDFYSPDVLYKVLIVQDFIATIQDVSIKDLFNIAFAATMIRFSNYSYEPSLGRRASAGKENIHDFPVAQTIIDKLTEMEEDVIWLQNHLADHKPKIHIIHDSFFNQEAHLEPDSVDMIITSPPYLNNYHYNRNTRPQLYWLGYAEKPQDLKALEAANFGKYWQTVRELPTVELAFTLPDTDIVERLEQVRSCHPERGIYGGHGWANYAATYFNDCYVFARNMQRVLKPGGTALIVIGNSILQGVFIPTDQYLAKIAEMAGLDIVNIDIPRTTRVGNSIIQSDVRVARAQKSHQLYEAVVELRKR